MLQATLTHTNPRLFEVTQTDLKLFEVTHSSCRLFSVAQAAPKAFVFIHTNPRLFEVAQINLHSKWTITAVNMGSVDVVPGLAMLCSVSITGSEFIDKLVIEWQVVNIYTLGVYSSGSQEGGIIPGFGSAIVALSNVLCPADTDPVVFKIQTRLEGSSNWIDSIALLSIIRPPENPTPRD